MKYRSTRPGRSNKSPPASHKTTHKHVSVPQPSSDRRIPDGSRSENRRGLAASVPTKPSTTENGHSDRPVPGERASYMPPDRPQAMISAARYADAFQAHALSKADTHRPLSKTDSHRPSSKTEAHRPLPKTDSHRPSSNTDSHRSLSKTDSQRPVANPDSHRPQSKAESQRPLSNPDPHRSQSRTDHQRPLSKAKSHQSSSERCLAESRPAPDSTKPPPVKNSVSERPVPGERASYMPPDRSQGTHSVARPTDAVQAHPSSKAESRRSLTTSSNRPVIHHSTDTPASHANATPIKQPVKSVSHAVIVDLTGNDPVEAESTSLPLPEGWLIRISSTGKVYYVNAVTRTSQWHLPTEPAVDVRASTSSKAS